jgi:hypothetical protein
MKSQKASGPSGITSDILKALGEEGIGWIHNIIKDIWVSKPYLYTNKMVTQWNVATIGA